MDRATEVHLEGITEKSYAEWLINDAFITYASSTNEKGLIELGANGDGTHAVRVRHKTGRDTHYCYNAKEAVNLYKKLCLTPPNTK